jgi:hypothetical protein
LKRGGGWWLHAGWVARYIRVYNKRADGLSQHTHTQVLRAAFAEWIGGRPSVYLAGRRAGVVALAG